MKLVNYSTTCIYTKNEGWNWEDDVNEIENKSRGDRWRKRLCVLLLLMGGLPDNIIHDQHESAVDTNVSEGG